jgi:hypothetical protein
MVLGVTVTALVIVGLIYRRQARQDRTSGDLPSAREAVAGSTEGDDW